MNQPQIQVLPSDRASLRRGVEWPVGVASSLWDGEIPFVATDVSGGGLFVECALPLEAGEEVELRFSPPGFDFPFEFTGEIRRAVLARRKSDGSRSGMGISFTGLSLGERLILEYALEGTPPRLPVTGRESFALAEIVVEDEAVAA